LPQEARRLIDNANMKNGGWKLVGDYEINQWLPSCLAPERNGYHCLVCLFN